MQEVVISEPDAVLQLGLVGPAEGRRLAYVEQLVRRAVGTGGVPFDLARVTHHLGYQFRQRLDGQLLARSRIDSLVAAVVIHQEDAEVGQVVDIEELPER